MRADFGENAGEGQSLFDGFDGKEIGLQGQKAITNVGNRHDDDLDEVVLHVVLRQHMLRGGLAWKPLERPPDFTHHARQRHGHLDGVGVFQLLLYLLQPPLHFGNGERRHFPEIRQLPHRKLFGDDGFAVVCVLFLSRWGGGERIES